MGLNWVHQYKTLYFSPAWRATCSQSAGSPHSAAMMTLNTSTGQAFGTSNLGNEHINPLLGSKLEFLTCQGMSRVKVALMNQQKRKAILEQPETSVTADSQIGGLLLYALCLLWAKSAARGRSKAPCHPRSSCLPARFGIFLSVLVAFLKPAAFSNTRSSHDPTTKCDLPVLWTTYSDMFRPVQIEWVKHGETWGNLSKSVLGEAEHDAISFLSTLSTATPSRTSWIRHGWVTSRHGSLWVFQVPFIGIEIL